MPLNKLEEKDIFAHTIIHDQICLLHNVDQCKLLVELNKIIDCVNNLKIEINTLKHIVFAERGDNRRITT